MLRLPPYFSIWYRCGVEESHVGEGGVEEGHVGVGGVEEGHVGEGGVEEGHVGVGGVKESHVGKGGDVGHRSVLPPMGLAPKSLTTLPSWHLLQLGG